MTDRSAVVTRIAPSPTGAMHIGTARTALFNWLYARHTGGTFLLRIEDTDRERSTEPSVQVILDGLAWLDLTPDAEPVFQFARADRHREVVEALLDRGHAYRDYTPPDDFAREREALRAQGRAYRSSWRDRDPREGGDNPFVVRFKGPTEGETRIADLVKGDVVFGNKELDDLVLLRTDGTPTYNLAVVVDDHDMGITHVIRGDDHLNNAARQALIYEAMDWPRPAFGHLPMIHGPDGAKLSKRHGAQAVGEFAEMGYLPEAMRNYLARLGWGHGDAEIFSDAEAQAWFDVVDVGASPARLDWAKLNHINQHYIRVADDARLIALVEHIHLGRGLEIGPVERERLERAIPLVKDGAHTLLQLADLTSFVIIPRPPQSDEKTIKLLTPEMRERLIRLQAALTSAPEWSAPALAVELRGFADAQQIGMGKFGPALRAVLAGGASAPDLAGALAALGREESLGRLEDALSRSV